KAAVKPGKLGQFFGFNPLQFGIFQLTDQLLGPDPLLLVELLKLALFHQRPTMLLAICLIAITGSLAPSRGWRIAASSLCRSGERRLLRSAKANRARCSSVVKS